jgi:hypothetical protein
LCDLMVGSDSGKAEKIGRFQKLTDKDLDIVQDVLFFVLKDGTGRRIIRAFRRPVSEGLGPIEDILRITRDMLKAKFDGSKVPAYVYLMSIVEGGNYVSNELDLTITFCFPFLVDMPSTEEIVAKNERLAELLDGRAPEKKRARTFREQIEDAVDKKMKVDADSE